MNKDVFLLDGAAGTCLWEKSGDDHPVWRYNIERPEIVKELALEYLKSGSDVIYTNTFSANRMSVEGSGLQVKDVVRRGVEIAKEAVAEFLAEGTGEGEQRTPRVALDIGPLTGLLKPFGDIEREEAEEIYEEVIAAGLEAGPDMVVLETFLGLDMVGIAADLVRQRSEEIPLMISMTFSVTSGKKGARTLMGESVPMIVDALKGYHPEAIGINCSTGSDSALDVIREYSETTDIPLLFKPNAGTPKIEGGSQYDYSIFATSVSKALEFEGVKYIGGCCGSSPRYIQALAERIR